MPTNQYPPSLDPSEYADWDAYQLSLNQGTEQPTGVANPPPPATQPNGRINWDPETGRLTLDGEVLDRNDPRMYGSIGRNVTDQSTVDQGSYGANIASKFPPEFYEPYTEYDGDNGEVTRYRLRPEIAEQLGGQIQLGQSGVGGFGEVIDPSKLQWDDKFGILSKPPNIKAPDEGTFWDKYGMYMMMAPAAYGAAAGAGAGAGAIPTIADAGLLPAAGIAPEAGVLAAAPALAGGGTAGGIFGTGITLAQLGTGIRTAGSALGLAKALGIGGKSSSGGGSFLNSLAQGIGGYNESRDNKGTLDDFKQTIKDMIAQGDPYAPKRADAIRRLGELEANPGSVTDNPLFKSMNEKEQANTSRIAAARGYLNSSNEAGALQENFLANMHNFYDKEWTRIAKEAGVNVDPSTMASAGIRAAGDVAKGQFNRTAGNNALIQRLLGGGGDDDGVDIWSILGKLFGDDDDGEWGFEDGSNDIPDVPNDWEWV